MDTCRDDVQAMRPGPPPISPTQEAKGIYMTADPNDSTLDVRVQFRADNHDEKEGLRQLDANPFSHFIVATILDRALSLDPGLVAVQF